MSHHRISVAAPTAGDNPAVAGHRAQRRRPPARGPPYVAHADNLYPHTKALALLAQPRRSTNTRWEEAEADRPCRVLFGAARGATPATARSWTRARLPRTVLPAHQRPPARPGGRRRARHGQLLPHPDPAVDTLAALAATLRDQAAGLRTADEVSEDWWSGYFDNLRREADDAVQQPPSENGRDRPVARPGPLSALTPRWMAGRERGQRLAAATSASRSGRYPSLSSLASSLSMSTE